MAFADDFEVKGTLSQRMLSAATAIGGVKKEWQGKLNYNAHTIDTVVEACHPALMRAGLIFKIRPVSIEPVEGSPFPQFIGKYLCTIEDAETADKYEAEWVHVFSGRTEKSGFIDLNKTSGIAVSYVMKDFLKRTFLIYDPMDDDADRGGNGVSTPAFDPLTKAIQDKDDVAWLERATGMQSKEMASLLDIERWGQYKGTLLEAYTKITKATFEIAKTESGSASE